MPGEGGRAPDRPRVHVQLVEPERHDLEEARRARAVVGAGIEVGLAVSDLARPDPVALVEVVAYRGADLFGVGVVGVADRFGFGVGERDDLGAGRGDVGPGLAVASAYRVAQHDHPTFT